MEILNSISELEREPGPIFAAIGVFDGVHLGHQAVISTSAKHAKAAGGTAVVVTFDPHPMKVLRPEKPTRLLTATQHKIALIRGLGVEHLLVIKFDRNFAATPPAKFILELVQHSRPLREICVGHEWAFGRNRAGNIHLLRELGMEHGFDVIGVAPVMVEGVVVSSTAIREAIQQGDFARARQMLGRDYTILGTVVKGAGLGRGLGFPTANLSAHAEQFPPDGVYAIEANINGEGFQGVANLGYRPTLESKEPHRLLELHLFDFDREIYGADAEVCFLSFLRGEEKFAGLDELRAQIARDVAQARKYFSSL